MDVSAQENGISPEFAREVQRKLRTKRDQIERDMKNEEERKKRVIFSLTHPGPPRRGLNVKCLS